MGGLVGRSASILHGASSNILGIVHGVQPATGAAAAYWRVKAGFEGMGPTSRVLGNSGKNVTPILGNMPGGLELLPNQHYETGGDNSTKQWLQTKRGKTTTLSLPKSDPYKEIYKIKGTGNEIDHPDRKYWGLIDPDLLDPGRVDSKDNDGDKDSLNSIASDISESPWEQYSTQINKAESFHRDLKDQMHDNTFCFHGIGHTSTSRIEFKTESVIVEWDAYPKRGFRGRFENDNAGKKEQRRALLQDPDGQGDGTVPTASGSAFSQRCNQRPTPLAASMEHEPAYNNDAAREYVVQSILVMCEQKIAESTK